jgi:D-glycero-beta-D-manno-heptose 1-phosphate adenylyltransferase
MGEVVKAEKLTEVLKDLKLKNKKIVTTNGCFDILHVGHVRYLKLAKELGDVLIIGLNTDRSVKALKGPKRPLNSENDRAEVLATLNCVDYVVLFDEDTPAKLLDIIKPDIHAKGGDYNIDTLPEAEVIIKNGGKVVFIPLVKGKSTTSLIEKVSKK